LLNLDEESVSSPRPLLPLGMEEGKRQASARPAPNWQSASSFGCDVKQSSNVFPGSRNTNFPRLRRALARCQWPGHPAVQKMFSHSAKGLLELSNPFAAADGARKIGGAILSRVGRGLWRGCKMNKFGKRWGRRLLAKAAHLNDGCSSVPGSRDGQPHQSM